MAFPGRNVGVRMIDSGSDRSDGIGSRDVGFRGSSCRVRGKTLLGKEERTHMCQRSRCRLFESCRFSWA